MNSEKYAIPMACLNCGAEKVMEFDKGREVPRKALCAACGCHTMIKVLKAGRNDFAEICDVFFNGREAK